MTKTPEEWDAEKKRCMYENFTDSYFGIQFPKQNFHESVTRNGLVDFLLAFHQKLEKDNEQLKNPKLEKRRGDVSKKIRMRTDLIFMWLEYTIEEDRSPTQEEMDQALKFSDLVLGLLKNKFQ